jgi:hypothetical protein
VTLPGLLSAMDKSDDKPDLSGQALKRLLQEELHPIEPPAEVREDILRRILDRTVRSWREWLGRSKDRLND